MDTPQSPIIVVSVAPLAALVRDLMPQATVQVLISGSKDFHHFQWQPTQVAQVQRADWVVWLGPQQEPAMEGILKRLPESQRITLFPPALHAAVPSSTHMPTSPVSSTLSDKSHPHPPEDIHLWLQPAAVEQMVAILGDRWKINTIALKQQQKYRLFWSRWQTRLSPLAKRPFVIQHDAIRGWAQHLGLTQFLAITSDHEHQPGVQQLLQIRQRIRQAQLQPHPVVCYLQTQLPDSWWPKISADLTRPINTAQLDLFSINDAPLVDESHHLGFIQQNLEKLETCLMVDEANVVVTESR